MTLLREFYRISSAKSPIMQEQLTPSPFPLIPPMLVRRIRHMMYCGKKSNLADLLPAIKVKVRSPADPLQWDAWKGHTPEGTHSDTHWYTSLTALHRKYTCLVFISIKLQRECVFHYAETCKPPFSVHLDRRAHCLLPWDGETRDIFWFLSFPHFRTTETIWSFFSFCFISIPYRVQSKGA